MQDTCPKCNTVRTGESCPTCGVVFAKFDASIVDAGVPDILVAVSRRTEGARVKVTGPFTLLGATGREIGITNDDLAPVRVRASGGGLAVGEVQLKHTRLEFRPAAGEEVWLDGVPLPGSAVLARSGNTSMLTSAVLLDVEGYTCAAVAHYADWRRWSEETLAAHAVCLRTLALYRRTLLLHPRRTGKLIAGCITIV